MSRKDETYIEIDVDVPPTVTICLSRYDLVTMHKLKTVLDEIRSKIEAYEFNGALDIIEEWAPSKRSEEMKRRYQEWLDMRNADAEVQP